MSLAEAVEYEISKLGLKETPVLRGAETAPKPTDPPPKEEEEEDKVVISDYNKDKPDYTGSTCSECGQPQFNTDSGITCSNGHGGAEGIDLDLDDLVIKLQGDALEFDPADCKTIRLAYHKMTGSSCKRDTEAEEFKTLLESFASAPEDLTEVPQFKELILKVMKNYA